MAPPGPPSVPSPVTYICFSQVVTGLCNSDVGIIFSLSRYITRRKVKGKVGCLGLFVSAPLNGKGYQLFSHRRLFRIFIWWGTG
jgi:hypothetical protein